MHAKVIRRYAGRFRQVDGHRRHRIYDYTPEAWGKIQWDRKGCSTCHSLDGTPEQGPYLEGHLGQHGKAATTEPSVLVDEAYVRESMMLPQAKIVAGFDPIMPTFQGLAARK